ncbi:MAG TPA: SH3 domain-containing protein [Steroidobacteraceae bacterium]|nr:SH3 domain-containing protein [Steroidobacteraceae bacterium]
MRELAPPLGRSALRSRALFHACALLVLLVAPLAVSAREYLQVFVTAPYLELHTGPGRGYPVFHVVERSESVDVLKRRTDWFKVRTERGVEGWAAQHDMLKTVLADGTPFTFDMGDRAGFTSHHWEGGVFLYGDWAGASEISAYGSYSLTNTLQVELTVSEFLGNTANGTTADIGLAHVFFPQWRWSPFVSLGTGIVQTEPKATLVVPADRSDQSAYVGAGIRIYLTRRFFLRGEYKDHIIFTKRNENEKVDEWKAGFGFFF